MDASKIHLARELQHDSPMIGCRFDRSGNYVFFSAEDFRVWRWEWATDTKIPFVGHDSWVRGMCCDPANQTLITGGYDGRLIWWPLAAEKPEPIRKVDAHAGWIRAVSVSPDGKLIASAGNDRLVKLWSAADGSLVRELRGHEAHVYNAAFHPSGTALVSGDHKCNLFHWDVAEGKLVRQLKLTSLHKYDDQFKADIGGFLGMAFTADGKRLAASGITNVTNAFACVGNPQVVEIDWEAGKELIQHESKAKVNGVAWGVVLHPDNVTIGVSGGPGGGFLYFWKPDQKEEFFQFKLPNTGRDLDLAPDGLHVVVAHHDRKTRVFKLAEKT